MAITKIKGLKTTLDKAFLYIENPEKTDGQLLVSGYNTDPLSASSEFAMTAALAREMNGDYRRTGGAENRAYHMMQSFSPHDHIAPKKAHELGRQWADKILDGKYEYVIATHVDKDCVHNHVVFNSISFYDYKCFDSRPYKTARLLREVSDKICEENGLYVVRNLHSNLGRTHYEWEQEKHGASWKAQVRKSIDCALEKVTTWEDFCAELQHDGIEVLV